MNKYQELTLTFCRPKLLQIFFPFLLSVPSTPHCCWPTLQTLPDVPLPRGQIGVRFYLDFCLQNAPDRDVQMI